MSYYIIPVNNTPNSVQTFKLTLDGGRRNINIKLKLRYNDILKDWTASVTDNSNGKRLIDSMSLVCGVDLLGQFQHLNIGHAFVVPTTETPLMMPDNKTLGSTFILCWGDST